MTQLKPYRPTKSRPWDTVSVAHLLRRAGFAPSADEVARALKDGPQETVDRLLNEGADSVRHNDLDALGASLAIRDDIDRLRGWWLLRMVHTRRPLHARMAVFWHNHFATSNVKVRSAQMMLQQLRTFERYGLGRFEDLLLAVSRDPAMIAWLDGDQNVKGRPNENYARELFELFALGVGHYTEKDIKEAARAFTGWHQRNGRFRFVARNHDGGSKTVFGKRGAFGGEDVVRLAVRHSASAPFLSRRLLREFLCPSPPDALVEELAHVVRETRFEIKATLRTLLLSEAMFDPRWYRARIKSPVEYAVGLLRSLGMGVSAPRLADAVSQMGQRLFEPPSVKGWDDHRAWLNSATMLVRLNAATRVLRHQRFEAQTIREQHGLETRESVIAFCTQLALDGRVPDLLRAHLQKLNSGLDDLLRDALRVLFTSPEYQMA